ncbi:MAG TPA: hypothetical protein VHZ50_15810, partial [Puia sp.]|nr:hypothetical protein [Puia sp.]
MEFAHVLENSTTWRKISFGLLCEIISTENQSYTKYSGDEKTLYFENYAIESDDNRVIYFGEEFNITLRICFKNCFFVTEKIIFISGMVCANYVTFENCYFPNGIYIDKGNFQKELSFRRIHTKDFHLTGGSFGKISFSGDEVSKTWITGSKFVELNISYWNSGNTPQELTIINNKNELGNINVRGEHIS